MSEKFNEIAFEAVSSCGLVLGALFSEDPRNENARRIIDGLSAMALPEEWPFGAGAELERAGALIKEGAAESGEALADEYKRQFVGPGHFEAPAWGSVYLDSDEVVFGVSTLELRQWMRANGIERSTDADRGREPDDHIGKMVLLMGWLAESKPELLPEYLAEHLMPWAPRYLDLLEESAQQPFYEGLAVLARATLAGIAGALGVEAAKKPLFH